eukprot:TRINITY_DN23950_c0_g1_i1.p1 TRINITY_DN23950_c0_g1~~TRINITY_DN23950_c0_g1_i1.p1  ORF type:complete len:579 (+),score=148.77 TRINITY_DN23950_c0_g1_i1:520-2256(+)
MPEGAPLLSNNEVEFILAAIKEDTRIDGRPPFQSRGIHIAFGRSDGTVEVQLGQTRVLVVVSAELTEPYKGRPNEGTIAIHAQFSPMADPTFEVGRPRENAIELGRMLDRGLRESRAIDAESLCVAPGRSVWAIRVDAHILDNGGNLIDAANLGVLAGLLSFRRPDAELGGPTGKQINVFSPEERDPVPLAMNHLPVAVTFAFFNDGENVVMDPSLKEEAAMGGRMTMSINANGELCALQKGGGVPIRPGEVLRCMRIAQSRAKAVAKIVKTAVDKHMAARLAQKVKRHPVNAPTDSAGPGEREVILHDRDWASGRTPGVSAALDTEAGARQGSKQGLRAGAGEGSGRGGGRRETDQAPKVKQEPMDGEEMARRGDVEMTEGQGEGEEEEDDDEESEEEEEDEEGQMAVERRDTTEMGGAAAHRPRVKTEPLSWLEEREQQQKEGAGPQASGRKRGGSGQAFDAEARDEFAQVAAMLSSAAEAGRRAQAPSAASTPFAAVEAGGGHGAFEPRQNALSGGGEREVGNTGRLAAARSGLQRGVPLERGKEAAAAVLASVKIEKEDEELSLASAVKIKKKR